MPERPIESLPAEHYSPIAVRAEPVLELRARLRLVLGQPATEVRVRQGLRDPVSLHDVAMQLSQQLEFGIRLDTFGDDLEVESMCDTDDCFDEMPGPFRIAHRADEGLVDL